MLYYQGLRFGDDGACPPPSLGSPEEIIDTDSRRRSAESVREVGSLDARRPPADSNTTRGNYAYGRAYVIIFRSKKG